jgi:hypothetical protein
MATPHQTLALPKALGNGLVMRLATEADIETMAAFNKRLHEEENDPPDSIALWTRDLMSGRHPTTSAADFVLVEDTSAGNKLISATCLIPQTWAYDGLAFPVGRPELVATDPDYRRRGLVKAVMEQIHALSHAYGHLVQGITGIPWYYRQFGYEYALELGGGYPLPADAIPTLANDETEPFQTRPAAEADLSRLISLHKHHYQGGMITAVHDQAQWRYILFGQHSGSIQALQTDVILDDQGALIGYFTCPAVLWGTQLALFELVTNDTVSLHAVLPTVLRALKQRGETLAGRRDPAKTFSGLYLSLEPARQIIDILKAKLGPRRPPYAWYIRVPDLPAFTRHIAPVLEDRLGRSVMRGHSGKVNLTFFRGGLQMTFDHGKLAEVSDWQDKEQEGDRRSAGFPYLTFLQLLFGYRSLDELQYAFPDCRASDEATLLLNILFPRKPSQVAALN